MTSRDPMHRPDRRTAIKWMLAAAGVIAARPGRSHAADATSATPAPTAAGTSVARGYGTDPDMMRAYSYGDYWPLTLSDDQRRLAAALCAMIIPADDKSPSAADLHVHDFIDEWISAPYPDQQADREIVLQGFLWIEAEAARRFGRPFVSLIGAEQSAIADDICHVPAGKPGMEEGARFFRRFRELTAGGFYTTPEGMRDIGYVGNVPSFSFEGPPPEVIAKLGLD